MGFIALAGLIAEMGVVRPKMTAVVAIMAGLPGASRMPQRLAVQPANALAPASRRLHETDNRKHDGHLDEDTHNGGECGAGLETEQTIRSRNR